MAETPFSDWLLTVPLEHKNGTTRTASEAVKALAQVFPAFIGQPERGGKTAYRHLQIFGQLPRTRFSTLKRKLSAVGLKDVHIEPRGGTVAEAVGYCTKAETRDGGIIRHGEIDSHKTENPQQGHRSDLDRLRARVLAGESISQILLSDDGPTAAGCMRWLREVAAAYEDSIYRTKIRDVRTVYLWGTTGVGKTRHVIETEGIGNVYIVDDYAHPFDKYEGQPVILLDEFSGQLNLEYMLRLLDRYPLQLQARYRNPWARFERVWITSNVSADELYSWASPEKRAALFRRIQSIQHLDSTGHFTEDSKPVLLGLSTSALRKPVPMSPELAELLGGSEGSERES